MLITHPEPIVVVLPRSSVAFLADCVGGTGYEWWGDIAVHHGLSDDDVRRLWEALMTIINPTIAEKALRKRIAEAITARGLELRQRDDEAISREELGAYNDAAWIATEGTL